MLTKAIQSTKFWAVNLSKNAHCAALRPAAALCVRAFKNQHALHFRPLITTCREISAEKKIDNESYYIHIKLIDQGAGCGGRTKPKLCTDFKDNMRTQNYDVAQYQRCMYLKCVTLTSIHTKAPSF